jgi:hypothetical protein
MGTTGMNETFLERLTRARQDHLLAPFRGALIAETPETTPRSRIRSHPDVATPVSVALVG